MSKMGLHDSFEHLKDKLWPKEGPKVKGFQESPMDKMTYGCWPHSQTQRIL